MVGMLTGDEGDEFGAAGELHPVRAMAAHSDAPIARFRTTLFMVFSKL
jgi:hypothetical protein